MEYFCNLTALLSIDSAAHNCFAALPSSVKQALAARGAQLHTRDDLLLCAVKLLTDVQ